MKAATLRSTEDGLWLDLTYGGVTASLNLLAGRADGESIVNRVVRAVHADLLQSKESRPVQPERRDPV